VRRDPAHIQRESEEFNMHDGIDTEFNRITNEIEFDLEPLDRSAKAVIRERVDELPFEERFAIRWFYGIGGLALGHEEIGDRLGLDKTEVWERICRGMEDIGFYLVEEMAA
jgi:DNA-directed RNA polymerase specialized sigma24 family protein